MNTATVTGLEKGTTYSIKIRAIVKADKNYKGDFSKPIEVTTK